jgi:hypothetical protein
VDEQMDEIIEFRIPEANAREHIPHDIGERLGTTVRRVLVATNDPLFIEIRRLDHDFRARGDVFFTGWRLQRRYSRRELQEAELFHVWPSKVFDPAAEECGTQYNNDTACPDCGGGATQVTPLYLPGQRIPRNVDFAQTIAGEAVVSSRVVDAFREEDLRGATFEPVRITNQEGKPSNQHFELKVVGKPAELDSSTRTGGSLFDESSYGRCPRGDVVGLNLLSEVTVLREGLMNADVIATKEMIGVRRGLLRPRPILLLSPKAWRTIEQRRLKGLIIEIAHLS